MHDAHHTDTKSVIPYYIIVYSAEWAKAIALKYLCGYSYVNKRCCIYVNIAKNIDELFFLLSEKKTCAVVLDIPVRNYVSMLCHIRRRYPVLPIVATQAQILFSDQIVAGWFGYIRLLEYNILMDGYPDIPAGICVTDLTFDNTAAACATECNGGEDDIQILNDAKRWLCTRLAEIVESERCASVVTECLFGGGTPQMAGIRQGCSDKLIYHYRWRAVKALGLSGQPNKFIPSLLLKGGPVTGIYPCTCRLRLLMLGNRNAQKESRGC